ncbi:hypothetical protein [Beijerinckia indica]|uniref:Uncharacterized protein n=1 Tax=Beijerinckia indica subsp. indica (strain ATCC 9039 / DSM 1715 / NCIMB 8712) TaxID=395963 RepID=B2IEH2_BEII9|nr:hypothetical protein [Beijerinckia indica]ACB95570.1 hypothetical protein Bind_1947 [Beijerinckia indica subsp. indica ATCC 9039]
MFKTVALLTAVFLGAIMVAFLVVTPHIETVEARASEMAPAGCVSQEVSLDEGYGVTRKELRLVCADR